MKVIELRLFDEHRRRPVVDEENARATKVAVRPCREQAPERQAFRVLEEEHRARLLADLPREVAVLDVETFDRPVGAARQMKWVRGAIAFQEGLALVSGAERDGAA